MTPTPCPKCQTMLTDVGYEAPLPSDDRLWCLHTSNRCRDVLHAQLQHAQARERELSEILDADRHETLVHAAAFMKAQRDEARAKVIAMAEERDLLENAMRRWERYGFDGTVVDALAKLDSLRRSAEGGK